MHLRRSFNKSLLKKREHLKLCVCRIHEIKHYRELYVSHGYLSWVTIVSILPNAKHTIILQMYLIYATQLIPIIVSLCTWGIASIPFSTPLCSSIGIYQIWSYPGILYYILHTCGVCLKKSKVW